MPGLSGLSGLSDMHILSVQRLLAPKKAFRKACIFVGFVGFFLGSGSGEGWMRAVSYGIMTRVTYSGNTVNTRYGPTLGTPKTCACNVVVSVTCQLRYRHIFQGP